MVSSQFLPMTQLPRKMSCNQKSGQNGPKCQSVAILGRHVFICYKQDHNINTLFLKPKNKLGKSIQSCDFWAHSSHNYLTTTHALLNMMGARKMYQSQQRFFFHPTKKIFPYVWRTNFYPKKTVFLSVYENHLVNTIYSQLVQKILTEYVYFTNTANRNSCHS